MNKEAYDRRSEPRSCVARLLEFAAEAPGRRPVLVRQALGEVGARVSAAGTALMRPCYDGAVSWRVDYVGADEEETERRLRGALSALDHRPEVTRAALERDAPDVSGARPVPFPLEPRAARGGLWLVWPREDVLGDPRALAAGEVEGFRRALESFLEVEHREGLYFRGGAGPLDEDLARALRNGDEEALPALLALARAASGADMAYWGSVRNGVVDVERHLGAMDEGFGFELPLGQGVGGRTFAGGKAIEVPDYRNSQYRYPGVSDVTDGEDVRSALAIPVPGADPRTGGVLYAVRRKVEPFSFAERALLGRLGRSIEPAPGVGRPLGRFFPSHEARTTAAKAELRRMLLDAKGPQEVEAWLERLIKGPAILADAAGRPYAPANADRLERLRASARTSEVVPLAGQRAPRGELRLWPSVRLPLPGWPDLLDDAAILCHVALDRAEQAHDHLNRARSRWLTDVMEGKTGPASLREGNRLGLPADRGEVWAVSWRPDAGKDEKEEMRLQMLAEEVVLDRLGSPLISREGGIGVLLLEDPARGKPGALRDELLRFFGPDPLWLVHGAGYDSLEALEDALILATRTAQRVRDENSERHVSKVGGRGLDGLLENRKLADALDDFANDLLGPLLLHDETTGSQLTETLCLVLTLGPEEAAKRLFVHANTIRYRMRRAASILEADLNSPKDGTATSLAAFIHTRRR